MPLASRPSAALGRVFAGQHGLRIVACQRVALRKPVHYLAAEPVLYAALVCFAHLFGKGYFLLSFRSLARVHLNAFAH